MMSTRIIFIFYLFIVEVVRFSSYSNECRTNSCGTSSIPFQASDMKVMSALVKEKDLIIYIGDTIINNLLVYLSLVGPEGNVIGVELKQHHFSSLVESIHTHNYTNNTLLLNSKLTYSFHDNLFYDHHALSHCYSRSHADMMTEECSRYLQLSLTRVYDIIGSICPSKVIFSNFTSLLLSSSGQQSSSLVECLLSGVRLLSTCKPIVLIEHIEPYNAQAIIEYLEHLGYAEMYWLKNMQGSSDKQVQYGLLASTHPILNHLMAHMTYDGSLDDDILHYFGLIRYIHGYYYLHEYDDILINKDEDEPSWKLWSPSCVDHTLPPCHLYQRRSYSFADHISIDTSIEVYEPILHPHHQRIINSYPRIITEVEFHSLIYPWLTDRSSYALGELYQRFDHFISKHHHKSINQSLVLIWNRAMSPSIDYDSAVYNRAMIQCHAWILSIYDAITSQHDQPGINDHVDDILFEPLGYRHIEDHDIRLHMLLEESNELQYLMRSCVESSIKQFSLVQGARSHAIQHHPDEYHSIDSVHDDMPISSSHAHHDRHMVMNITTAQPFEFRYNEDACLEPIWCNHLLEMQLRIRAWQYPDDPTSQLGELDAHQHPSLRRSCANSKYLIYEPVSTQHGIGSMIEQLASAFRYAICINRILVLQLPSLSSPTMLKWRFPGCRGSMMDCYFQPIQGCDEVLSPEDYQYAALSDAGKFIDEYPLRDTRVVRLHGLPSFGPCALCGSAWIDGHPFYDGFAIDRDPTNPTSAATRPPVDGKHLHLPHMGAMMTTIKLPWIAQFIRYIFRPQPWFAMLLQRIATSSLIGPKNESISTIARPFISLHIRYGMKILEEPLYPLPKYINALRRKYPHIRNIFISTETESVIDVMRRECPDLQFYHLAYPRVEYLDLPMLLERSNTSTSQDFIAEWMYSMANLYISAQADGFIGTLTSNWCALIQHLERTRGDGGYDYFSIDKGSAFTSCF